MSQFSAFSSVFEALEDRRLMSVSCYPTPNPCQPNGIPGIFSSGKGCKPVLCDVPSFGRGGKDCNPAPSCKPNPCDNPFPTVVSSNLRGSGKDCKPVDRCEVNLRSKDKCETDNKKSSKKDKRDGCRPVERCEQAPTFRNGNNDCRPVERCDNGPLFRGGKDDCRPVDRCEQGPLFRGGKDNCKPIERCEPDPCNVVMLRGNKGSFCDRPCKPVAKCEPQVTFFGGRGGGDCFSKLPCKPSCGPTQIPA